MAFGVATVVTKLGKQIFVQRVQHTPPAAGAGTPPVAGGEAFRFLSHGIGATAAARTAGISDTSLSNEQEARVTGTESIVTTTNTNDTYQVVGTVTCNAAAGYAVDEAGLWDIGTQSTTTTAQANAAATSIALTSGAVFAAGGGTCFAVNRTSNGAQTITYSGITANTMTCTALTGQINSGDRVVSGNLGVSATFNVISLNLNDSIAYTWKIQQT